MLQIIVVKLEDDPTACQYVTRELQLENSAKSFMDIIKAHINVDA